MFLVITQTLQPCRKCRASDPALAAEVRLPSREDVVSRKYITSAVKTASVPSLLSARLKPCPYNCSIMRLSRKLGVKLPNDVQHGLAQSSKRFYDPTSVSWRPMIERYIKRETCFHIHLRRDTKDSIPVGNSP